MRHDLDIDIDPWRRRDGEDSCRPRVMRLAACMLVGLTAVAMFTAL